MVDFFISKSIDAYHGYINRALSWTQSLAASTHINAKENTAFRHGDQSNSRLQGGGAAEGGVVVEDADS
jgi:hypothetical protein